ncbi:DNA helicase UvrD [Shewanella sp. UCD-FRSSP16_17]|uniref:UvrD-helicase domain-containing protein n=1 Tax=Shewanella sp. UCD-FRSSP16_17 TaxID=1853256 RepID=UPI0007EEDCE0|nr:ATP-dependent helicase [Shewanella sp. UCD-FRSSP16_17]OBT05506.1 DNA helicase UvrD [Shewanella sp. UCD-FRSSP16_17]
MSGFTPTDQQNDAISYKGNMVITACPGSGKTTVMKEKIRQITPELPIYKGVIAITFTRKASLELKNKCKQNAHNTKQSFFGTIDSFCYKELIAPFLSRVWKGSMKDCEVVKSLPTPYQDYLADQYMKSPNIEDLNNDSGFERLFGDGILWMSSFAAIALKVLNESSSARRYIKAKYSHIFIDEYQDTSASQHQLFLMLCKLGLTSTAVGDTQQSIFEFRGGSSELLEQLIDIKHDFKHFEMTLNHRCHPSIMNYASRLLNPDFQLLEYEGDTRVHRAKIDGNLKKVGEQISEWVNELLSSGEINTPSEIAILARKTNSIKLFSTGLKVPHRIYIDSPLDKLGTVCADLYSDLLAFTFRTIPTAQDLIDKQFQFSNSKKYQVANFRKQLLHLRSELSIDEFVDECRNFAFSIDIDDTCDSDRVLREILECDEHLKLFKPVDKSEVQVMSLHKCKGLEFKIVFHLDLEDWVFPYKRVDNGDWDNPIYPELIQEKNLHYVGITRAENDCVLIQAGLRRNSMNEFKVSKPSYFLTLPQLEGLYQQ